MKFAVISLLLLGASNAMSITDEATHETVLEQPDVVKDTVKEGVPEANPQDEEKIAPDDDLDEEEEPEGASDSEEGGDIIEETTTKDGSHIKKEIHTENGVKTIRITQ